MSSKIITAFLIAFALFSILDGIAAGTGGIAVTRLTADVNSTAVTIEVDNTQGFLRSDFIYINDEIISYTDTDPDEFQNCGRAYDGSTAATHVAGAKVYSSSASPLNAVLGYNIASTGSTVGAIDIPILIGRFFTTTIPKLVAWNFVILKTTLIGEYIRLVLQMISAGFLIYIAVIIIQALGGILQGIFTRR